MSYSRSFWVVILLSVALLVGVERGAAAQQQGAKPKAQARTSSKPQPRAKERARAQTRARAQARARAKARQRAAQRKRARRGFSGHAASQDRLRGEPLEQPSGDVWVYAVNFREEIKVNIYDEDGNFDDAALAELDAGFRCKRTGEIRAVDPRLYEVLSHVHDQYDGQRIELHSGFRFQQNEGSRHYHAAAMDIRIPGVPMRELYQFAESLDRGGMGIGMYPRSGFIHVDFRAPGDPSYRWTDRSRPGSNQRGKRPNRTWKKPPPKPTS